MTDLDAIRADLATLKPRAQVSILTDAQERLLYEAVPALLARVAELENTLATLCAGYAGRRDYAEEQAQEAADMGNVKGAAFWKGYRRAWAELVEESKT